MIPPLALPLPLPPLSLPVCRSASATVIPAPGCATVITSTSPTSDHYRVHFLSAGAVVADSALVAVVAGVLHGSLTPNLANPCLGPLDPSLGVEISARGPSQANPP
jgi:hypothetical protein